MQISNASTTSVGPARMDTDFEFSIFNLGQDRIVSATVKQGLDRDQIFHQIRDGR